MIAFRQSKLRIGFEPTTFCLKANCSAVELPKHKTGINQPNYTRKEDFNMEAAISIMQEIGIEPNISQSNDILISIAMYYLISTNSPMRSYKIQRVSTPLCNIFNVAVGSFHQLINLYRNQWFYQLLLGFLLAYLYWSYSN